MTPNILLDHITKSNDFNKIVRGSFQASETTKNFLF